MANCKSCGSYLDPQRTSCPSCGAWRDEADRKSPRSYATTVPLIPKSVKFTSPSGKRDIKFGLLILVTYWAITFAIAAVQVLFIQMLIFAYDEETLNEQSNDENSEEVEIEPVCDSEHVWYDSEECFKLGLKMERNEACFKLIIGPGIHLYAFYLIYRGANKLFRGKVNGVE